MSIHTRADLLGLGALVRRTFSTAQMSDTKWRKLFAALREAAPGIRMRVKFVDAAEPRDLGTPASIALHSPYPYVDTAAFGPVELRAIEWLEFPAVVFWSRGRGLPGREIVQDLDAVAARLAALGRFPVERTERGLRVRGYAR